MDDITKWDIKLLDMPVFVDGVKYNVDYKNDPNFVPFYNAVRRGARVTTATMNVHEYKAAFTPYLQNGQDIFYVAFSSGMSATFEQLAIAIRELKTEFPARTVYYADTLRIAYGSGVLAVAVAEKIANGESPAACLRWVEDIRHNIKLMFTVKDLKYLRAGGRISGISMAMGTLLNIKPILSFNAAGKIVPIVKTQGIRRAVDYYIKTFRETYNFDSALPIVVCATERTEIDRLLTEKLQNIVGETKRHLIIYRQVGPIVGCHSGVGSFALCFESKRRVKS